VPRIGGAEGARAAGWDGACSRCFRSHLLFPNLLCFPSLSQLTSCRVGRALGESIGAQFPLRAHLLSSSRAISPTHTAASRFFVRPRVAPRTSPCACSHLFALAASVGHLGDALITMVEPNIYHMHLLPPVNSSQATLFILTDTRQRQTPNHG